jgi:hypothetical protein
MMNEVRRLLGDAPNKSGQDDGRPWSVALDLSKTKAWDEHLRTTIGIGDRWLRTNSSVLLTALCLALLTIITIVDRIAPIDLHFTVFYLTPIFLASWYGSGRLGAALALLATGAWIAADYFSRVNHLGGAVSAWNAAVTCGIFITNSYTITRLRKMTKELDAARAALRECRDALPPCAVCGATRNH